MKKKQNQSTEVDRNLDFLWFLPTNGDVSFFGSDSGLRKTDNRYLCEIAEAADRLGYYGILLPTGPMCEDAWIVASSIVTYTANLKYLVALRPGSMVPAEAARQASAFDRLSEGRLLVNVVAGGDPGYMAGDGNFLSHDERYDQAADFLKIWRQLMTGETVEYSGRHYSSKGGKLAFMPVQNPYPPLYIGGSSEPAQQLAAEQVDMYLTWGEPPAGVAEKIAAVRQRASLVGRTLRFGIRLHIIVRETDEQAWSAANKLIAHVSDDLIAVAQKKLNSESDSVGQKRLLALHGGDRNRLEVSPNLWAGVGLVRPGAATALVGSPETVAARLREYQALGIDTVIASGYPHLEEAYRVAELLFPLVPHSRSRSDQPSAQARPSLGGSGAVLLTPAERKLTAAGTG